ncbi:MAG TPA: hypothetical protein ENI04_00715 [Candidatus Wildermuthbacteria bacterium]|nr:hypothetical protein [Candidatus Wildermuthbacteria bacterium]
MILLYLKWHFLEAPRTILGAIKNVLLFNLEYFSVVLLLKTLFSPWKRYQWSHKGSFSIKKSMEALVSNLISRTLGALIRGFIIIVGLISEVALLGASAFVFLGWMILPLLIILALFYGIRILI